MAMLWWFLEGVMGLFGRVLLGLFRGALGRVLGVLWGLFRDVLGLESWWLDVNLASHQRDFLV